MGVGSGGASGLGCRALVSRKDDYELDVERLMCMMKLWLERVKQRDVLDSACAGIC
jgi:hypothetical protein